MLKCSVIWAVLRRNVQAYFSGVIGYLVIVLFVSLAAFCAFSPEFFANNLANLDQLTKVFPYLLLGMVPAITMATWAEEKKLGTDEILFTLPASDIEILLGKYFSVLAIYTAALAFSLTQLFALAWIGDPDWGIVFTTYLGYWLAGAALLSAGMFASVLTSSTTVAYVLGATFCAVPVLIGNLAPGNVFIQSLSLSAQLRDFSLGMIPLTGVLYFVTLAVFMLYLNIVFVSRRHWSRGRQASMGLHFALRSAALAAGLIALNTVANDSTAFFVSWADLTAERVHTLSPTTIETIEAADEKDREITVVAYLSPDVPQEFVHTRKEIVSLLRQYDRVGSTTIDVQLINVEPNSKEARNARNDGVEPRRLSSEVAGKQVEQDVYLGVVMKSDINEIKIPFLDGETALEYELSRALASVTTRPERLKIGVLEADGLSLEPSSGGMTMRDWYQRALSELDDNYKLIHVSPSQLADYLPQPKDDTDKTDEDDDKAPTADTGGDQASDGAGDCDEDDSATQPADDETETDETETDETETDETSSADESGKDDGGEKATDGDDEATDEDSDDADEGSDDADKDSDGADEGEKEEEKEEEKDPAPDVLIVVQPNSLTQDVMDDLIKYMELGNPVLLLDDPLPFFPFVYHRPEDIGIVNAPLQERPAPRSGVDWATVAPQRPTNELQQFMTLAEQRMQPQIQQLQQLPPQFQAQMRNQLQQQLQMQYFQYLDEHPEHGPRFESKTYPTYDEMQILEVLWDKGPSELKEIHKGVEKRRGEFFAENVTKHLVLIMQDKKFIKSDKQAGDTFHAPLDDSPEIFQSAIGRSDSKSKLMSKLGLEWSPGRVVTDLYDPHPEFTPDVSPQMGTTWPKGYGKRENLLVFVSPDNGTHDAFSDENTIASGLQKMLFIYPGTVRKADASELNYSPIVTTGPDSSLIPWNELTFEEIDESRESFNHVTGQTGSESRPKVSGATGQPLRRLVETPTFSSDKGAHVIAAHVTSDKSPGINAVFVADTDFLTDFYFMQQEKLDKPLDNLLFLHNAIEVLAGDDSLLALRRRRARPRQLTAIQDEIDKYRRERAEEQQKIEKKIAKQLKEADEELKKKEAEIGNVASSANELFAMVDELGQARSTTRKSFEKKKKKLNEELQSTIDKLKEKEQSQINRRETEARVWAVVLPPLPALLLGIIVLVIRVVNERRQVVATRRR